MNWSRLERQFHELMQCDRVVRPLVIDQLNQVDPVFAARLRRMVQAAESPSAPTQWTGETTSRVSSNSV